VTKRNGQTHSEPTFRQLLADEDERERRREALRRMHTTHRPFTDLLLASRLIGVLANFEPELEADDDEE
jgi:hypothetical protein